MFRLEDLPKRMVKKIVVNPETGCWEWTAAKQSGGYGMCRHKGKMKYAHRLTFQLLKGDIPEGLCLDHLCRNRCCCNPAHLEAVTNKENILRGESIWADNARKTHCKNGHEFTKENTYHETRKNGRTSRVCRECSRAEKRLNQAGRRATKKAAAQ